MTLRAYFSALQNKRIAVIGIGVSNTPLIQAMLAAGLDVTACDKKPRSALGALGDELERAGCALCLGEDYLDRLDQDVIFRTPGLHPRFLERAKERGAEITSEMEAFFQLCPCPIVGVTGSDGKTTTTTIIAGLLEAAGRRVHLGGNIGHPLLTEVDSIAPGDVAVVELSSFQLMDMDRSPHIAVLTNLSPNHLDVHKDYAEYIQAKTNIFRHQSPVDRAVFNLDNAETRRLSRQAVGRCFGFTREEVPERGTYLSAGYPGDHIWMVNDRGHRAVLSLDAICLPGWHNVENYMAAIAAVDGLVPNEAIADFAAHFQGV